MIPLVAASEAGRAQNEKPACRRCSWASFVVSVQVSSHGNVRRGG